MKYPSVTIIIPSYNSEKVISLCLTGAASQNYPIGKYEVIVVDNYSTDKTRELAKSFGAQVYLLKGKPSQGCAQRNLGAEKSKGEYVLFLDHDMEMSKNFLENFAHDVNKTENTIDAWYIPERVIAGNDFFSKVRTFEKSIYDGTVINAARIIKREKFDLTNDKYDPKLSNGPADWDMDIQLRVLGCKFGTTSGFIYHHEESLTFWKYVNKKRFWVSGIELYKIKWRKKDINIYNTVIKKQLGFYYRFIGVFVENGKWRILIPNIHLFLITLMTKILVSLVYIFKKISLYPTYAGLQKQLSGVYTHLISFFARSGCKPE